MQQHQLEELLLRGVLLLIAALVLSPLLLGVYLWRKWEEDMAGSRRHVGVSWRRVAERRPFACLMPAALPLFNTKPITPPHDH